MPSFRNKNRVNLTEVKILQRQNITEDLLLMWIEKPDGFTFKPGQYCTIGYDGVERAYSISSAPYEKNIELFVELVPPPDGVLTPKIWELFPGDSVTIRPRAKGLFTLKPSLPNQLMLSTVTGVVPYISIIREYLHNGEEDHHYYVLQGASHMNEFTYMKELHILANAHPELITYVPTVSRPHDKRNEDWSGEKGRVNNIVEKYIHEFSLSPKDTIVYTCGHPGMIENVKHKIIPMGFRVEEERFWKQD